MLVWLNAPHCVSFSIRCAHESTDIFQCMYSSCCLRAAFPSVPMMSRPDDVTAPWSRHRGRVTLCTSISLTHKENTLPPNHTASWKRSPCTSSPLSRGSRQATCMCRIVLRGPPPLRLGELAETGHPPAVFLSLLNPLINRPLCLFYRQ